MPAPGSFRPLASVKVGDEVASNLRDAIMSGVYASEERISVAQVAQALSVSNMPVREALVSLAHEGLLEAAGKGGYRVAQLRRQDIEDIFLIHGFIATLLAERAVPLITQKSISRLRALNAQVDRLAEKSEEDERVRARIESVNFTFHRTINKLVDAPRLHWFLRAATRYVPQHIYVTLPAWTQLTITEHPGIVDALEARDVELVRTRVADHVVHAAELVLDNLEARGFWVSEDDALGASVGGA